MFASFTFGFALIAGSIAPVAPLQGPVSASSSASSALNDADLIDANEAAAIRALRGIHAAQRTFRQAVEIDTNCDGIGEYGYFAELAGAQPMRVAEGFPYHPAAGTRADLLGPPLLPEEFGRKGRAYGFLPAYHGYYFEMWLAGPTEAGLVGAFREDPSGGKRAPPYPDPVNGSKYWICYAWPIHVGKTGIRAFCIHQRGVVLKTGNRWGSVFGDSNGPRYDEVLERANDLSSPLRIWGPSASGAIWKVVPPSL